MQQNITTTRIRNALIGVAATFAVASGSVHAADAKDFPASPVKLVVPFSAGGPADLAGRAIGQALGEELGTSVIIENRGGGGGLPAINAVSGATPDGHMLMFAASGNITVQPLLANPPINIKERLRPVGQATSSPHGLFISAKLPVNTLEEFIAYAKANPGKLNFATPGVGGLGHLGIEYFKSAAGVDAQTIHYKGSSQAVKDMVRGEVHAMLSSPASLQGLVDQGMLKIVGLTGPTKSPALQKIPLISATVPGFEYTTWYGIYAPSQTPDAVVAKLQDSLQKAGAKEALIKDLESKGVDIVVTSPQQLQQLADQDTAKWQKVINDAGISFK